MNQKIKNMFFDTMWKRIIITFVLIFLVVLIGGLLSINVLHDAITDNHIHSEVVNITDKSIDGNNYIITANNETYYMNNDGQYHTKVYNNIQLGRTYKIVIKEPELTDINQNPHIMQVYNVTS